ncbi:MAG: hypothetical protein OSB45_02325 [Pseudomonadales bacterium]|jgi:hypothetical protein|nr:hypothetical protein [Pseudomonadales bacterium]
MLDYEFRFVDFPPVILASYQSRVRVSDIPARIPTMFGQVYDTLLAVGIKQ